MPIDAARAAVKLVKNATLREYRGGDRGLPATSKEEINADLFAFIEARCL